MACRHKNETLGQLEHCSSRYRTVEKCISKILLLICELQSYCINGFTTERHLHVIYDFQTHMLVPRESVYHCFRFVSSQPILVMLKWFSENVLRKGQSVRHLLKFLTHFKQPFHI